MALDERGGGVQGCDRSGESWTIEEGLRRAQAIGLAQYEVRRWEGWDRHITLCLLAHACLEVIWARVARGETEVRQGVRALGGRSPRPTAPPSYAAGTTLKRKLVS